MQKNQIKHKVLMLGWEFAPHIAGGLGVVCRDITVNLAKNNDTQVTYVLPQLPSNFDIGGNSGTSAQYRVIGTNVKFLPISSNIISPYYSVIPGANASDSVQNSSASQINLHSEGSHNKNASNTTSTPLYSNHIKRDVEQYVYGVVKSSQNEDYNIIHNHDWMTAPAAIELKNITGKPMVMHVHATEMDRTLNRPNDYIFNIELEGFKAADRIIAVSEKTKEKILENYDGIDPSKIIVVHNAIERVEAKYGPIGKALYSDDKVVLFLARLTAMKGADFLLRAAKLVLEKIPNTKFLFVGAGELLEPLVELSVELDIAHKISFTGFLQHNQVDQAYQAADVFVMPSVAEPFGITPLEAIKNGTPVTLSKQAGVSEVLKNVLKVDFWDIDEMANMLVAVLRHGVLADELVNNSKRDLEELSWDKQTAMIKDIYHSLPRTLKDSQI